jgi:acetylglutamate synthase
LLHNSNKPEKYKKRFFVYTQNDSFLKECAILRVRRISLLFLNILYSPYYAITPFHFNFSVIPLTSSMYGIEISAPFLETEIAEASDASLRATFASYSCAC